MNDLYFTPFAGRPAAVPQGVRVQRPPDPALRRASSPRRHPAGRRRPAHLGGGPRRGRRQLVRRLLQEADRADGKIHRPRVSVPLPVRLRHLQPHLLVLVGALNNPVNYLNDQSIVEIVCQLLK